MTYLLLIIINGKTQYKSKKRIRIIWCSDDENQAWGNNDHFPRGKIEILAGT